MYNKIRKKIIDIILIMLVCCFTANCVNSKKIEESSLNCLDKFQFFLVKYYQEFAKNNIKISNWEDRKHFMKKAYIAAEGKNPLPENLKYWNIPEPKMKEFLLARDKLLSLLYIHKMKDIEPELSAMSQILFDCWVENQEKTDIPDLVKECRNDFYKSIYRLSLITQKINLNDKVKKKSKPFSKLKKIKPIINNKNIAKNYSNNSQKKILNETQTKNINSSYIIKLNHSMEKLKDQDKQSLRIIADYMKNNKDFSVNIISYYNGNIKKQEEESKKIIISKYRAQIIKDILKKAGAKEENITTYSYASLSENQIKEQSQNRETNSTNIVVGD